MLGVLCAAITPHLVEIREASRLSKLRFNLERLRQKIDDYRQRTGHAPETLDEVFGDEKTQLIPENPVSNAAADRRNHVKIIDSDPPDLRHVSGRGLGGWLYNPDTGGIWADNESFLVE